MNDRSSGAPAPSPAPADTSPEQRLFEETLAGNPLAANALIRALGRGGLRMAQQVLRSRDGAEDIVQEALLSLWRPAKTQPPPDDLATRFAADVIERCRVRLSLQPREGAGGPELLVAWVDGAAPEGLPGGWTETGSPSPTARQDARGLDRRVIDTVSQLPTPQRLVLAAWAYAERSDEALGKLIGADAAHGAATLRQASRALRELLGPSADLDPSDDALLTVLRQSLLADPSGDGERSRHDAFMTRALQAWAHEVGIHAVVPDAVAPRRAAPAA